MIARRTRGDCERYLATDRAARGKADLKRTKRPAREHSPATIPAVRGTIVGARVGPSQHGELL